MMGTHDVGRYKNKKLTLRHVENGLEAALARKVREKHPREVKFDGAFETRLISLACSGVPGEYRRWTVRLPANTAVEWHYTESVSHMSVQWVFLRIPPEKVNQRKGITCRPSMTLNAVR